MTPHDVLTEYRGHAAASAITDLVLCDAFLKLPTPFRRLILAYLVASRRHARRMAWSLRSLLDEPGFSAGSHRTRAAWIYLFGEEVLEEDATEAA
jgi:hypothetical protein